MSQFDYTQYMFLYNGFDSFDSCAILSCKRVNRHLALVLGE